MGEQVKDQATYPAKTVKGIWVLLLLLVGVPVIVDILLIPMSIRNNRPIIMTLFMVNAYLVWLPFYLLYLLVAYLIRFSAKSMRINSSLP